MVIEILPEAESDIQTAYAWYLDISEILANRFEAEVQKQLIAISQNYLCFKEVPVQHSFYHRKSGYPYSSRYPSQKKSGKMV